MTNRGENPANDDVLRRPLDIYAPFTPHDVRLLRSLVEAVSELVTHSCFDQVPTSVRLFGRTSLENPAMREPSIELTRGTAVLFRQLYKDGEEASFAKVTRCLKESVHARGSARRDAAIAELQDLSTRDREVLQFGAGVGIRYSDGEHTTELRPAALLDDYLYGVWVHSNNERTARTEARDASSPLPRYTAYQLIPRLTNVYFVTANIADLGLAEPALTGTAPQSGGV